MLGAELPLEFAWSSAICAITAEPIATRHTLAEGLLESRNAQVDIPSLRPPRLVRQIGAPQASWSGLSFGLCSARTSAVGASIPYGGHGPCPGVSLVPLALVVTGAAAIKWLVAYRGPLLFNH